MDIRYLKRENESGQEERFYPVTHAKAIVYGDDDKAIFDNIETHLNDTNNPHGIDCETIGAASKNYVDGVTNSIQTQLDNKANASALGDQVIFTLSGTTLTITSK